MAGWLQLKSKSWHASLRPGTVVSFRNDTNRMGWGLPYFPRSPGNREAWAMLRNRFILFGNRGNPLEEMNNDY